MKNIKPAGYAVFGTSEEYPRPIRIPGYDGSTQAEVLAVVLVRARKEGFKGGAEERLAELGWEVQPFYSQDVVVELQGLIREVMSADWRTNDNTLWPRLAAAVSEYGASSGIDAGREAGSA